MAKPKQQQKQELKRVNIHIDPELHKAFKTAAAAQDSSVDSHQASIHIHQRAARISRINRRVGLNKILVAGDAKSTAP